MLLTSVFGWRVKVAKARIFEVILKSPRMFISLLSTGVRSRNCALKPPFFVGSRDVSPGAPANSFINVTPSGSNRLGEIRLPETGGNEQFRSVVLFAGVISGHARVISGRHIGSSIRVVQRDLAVIHRAFAEIAVIPRGWIGARDGPGAVETLIRREARRSVVTRHHFGRRYNVLVKRAGWHLMQMLKAEKEERPIFETDFWKRRAAYVEALVR